MVGAVLLPGRLGSLIRRTLRDERGTSLVELLATVLILTIVLGAVLDLLDAAGRQAPKDQERAHAIRDAQVGVARMVRELRQAQTVYSPTTGTTCLSTDYWPPASATSNSFKVKVTLAGQPRCVLYKCDQAHPTNTSYRRCLRFESPVGVDPGTTTGQLVVDRVLNAGPGVFTFPSGKYVRAKVEVPARGERAEHCAPGDCEFQHKVVLDDGFYVRNVDGGV